MRLISFDALRTLHFPSHTQLKPDQLLKYQQTIRDADWVLYPPYWLINSLVFGLNARIFPSLPSYLIGHNKIEMTRAFEVVAPANTPWTLIQPNTPEYAETVWDMMSTPFVAKLPKSSMGEGVFLIEDRQQWRDYLDKTDVIYAQELLPIDRDLRLVVIGDKVVCGYWRIQSSYSFHNNVARGGEILHGPLPEVAVQLVESVARQLGVNHAGFDVAMVGNQPYLLEFNRLFGSRGLTAGKPIHEHIMDYLIADSDQDDPTRPVTPKDPARTGRAGRRRRAA